MSYSPEQRRVQLDMLFDRKTTHRVKDLSQYQLWSLWKKKETAKAAAELQHQREEDERLRAEQERLRQAEIQADIDNRKASLALRQRLADQWQAEENARLTRRQERVAAEAEKRRAAAERQANKKVRPAPEVKNPLPFIGADGGVEERVRALSAGQWPCLIYLYVIYAEETFWVYVGKHEISPKHNMTAGDCGVGELPDGYWGSGGSWQHAVSQLGIENTEFLILDVVPAHLNAALLEQSWITWARAFYGEQCLNFKSMKALMQKFGKRLAA